MGISLAVDISGCNFGMLDVFFTQFKGGAVIPLALMPSRPPGGSLVQNKNLSPGGPLFPLTMVSPSSLMKWSGFFNKPVHFGGGNEMIGAIPTKNVWPLPFWARKILPGARSVCMEMAWEPSKSLTASLKASSMGWPWRKYLLMISGMILVSVVMSLWIRSRQVPIHVSNC